MFIAPNGSEDQVFKGTDQPLTPTGTYQMKVIARGKEGQNLVSVVKTSTGNQQLSLLLAHTDGKFKAVRARIAIDGVDKNNNPLGRAFKQFLYALGVSEEDRNSPTTGVDIIAPAPEGEEWKGAEANVVINGDIFELNDKVLTVAVVQEEYQGKTRVKANSFYPAKA